MTDELVSTATHEGEQPVVETAVVEQPKEEAKGLSNREAMQAAIEKHKPEIVYKNRKSEEINDKSIPTKEEVKAVVSEDVEAPRGFNKQEIEAWKSKDITAIQKAYRRVHDEATREMNRAQSEERKAREEAQKVSENSKPIKQMAENVRAYLAARGEEDLPDEAKIAQALQLVNEMRKTDKAAIKAELRKAGIDLDAPDGVVNNSHNPEIDTLQKRLAALEQEKEAQRFNSFVNQFDGVFKKLGAEKTRTGDPVYPDILDGSDRANKIAKKIGSYALNPDFVEGVKERFPEADFSVIAREAYIFAGGRIGGQAASVPNNNNQQIEKQRRAAASTPGKPAVRADVSTLKGKLGNRAAARKALEIHGWEN
jgi:DNA-binding phage protein